MEKVGVRSTVPRHWSGCSLISCRVWYLHNKYHNYKRGLETCFQKMPSISARLTPFGSHLHFHHGAKYLLVWWKQQEKNRFLWLRHCEKMKWIFPTDLIKIPQKSSGCLFDSEVIFNCVISKCPSKRNPKFRLKEKTPIESTECFRQCHCKRWIFGRERGGGFGFSSMTRVPIFYEIILQLDTCEAEFAKATSMPAEDLEAGVIPPSRPFLTKFCE